MAKGWDRSCLSGPSLEARFGLVPRRLVLVLATLLPGLAGAGLGGGVAARLQHAAAEAGLQERARALSLAMDQEIALHLNAVEALATLAEPEAAGGLAGLDAPARKLAAALGTSIFVHGPGPAWRQLLDTARPAGAALPDGLAMGFDPRAPVPRAVSTGRPALGDTGAGPVPGAPPVVVAPVLRGGQTQGAVGAVLEAHRLSRPLAALAAPGPGGGSATVATLVDGKGAVVSRSERAEEAQGRIMPGWYAAAIAGRNHGVLAPQRIEGRMAAIAFQRLASDPAWVLLVSRPLPSPWQGWQVPLAALGAGGATALGFGLLAAGLRGRRTLPAPDAPNHAPPEAPAETGPAPGRLVAALDSAPAMIRGQDGTILHWSGGMEELFGWPAETAEGRLAAELLATEYPVPEAAIQAALQRDGRWEGQLRYRARDGRVVVVASRWRLHHAPPWPDPVVVESVADITLRVEAERSRDLVAREQHHRVKNLLATVQALAAQTMRSGIRDPEEFASAFSARLRAMSRAQDLLTAEDWRDAELAAVLRAALAPWLGGGGRIALAGGGQARISARQAQALVLALHELATNAGKHGALSVPEGRVLLWWRVTPDGMAALDWTERGGPPVVPPARRGLGSRLLDALPRELGKGAVVTIRYEPGGLRGTIRFSTRPE